MKAFGGLHWLFALLDLLMGEVYKGFLEHIKKYVEGMNSIEVKVSKGFHKAEVLSISLNRRRSHLLLLVFVCIIQDAMNAFYHVFLLKAFYDWASTEGSEHGSVLKLGQYLTRVHKHSLFLFLHGLFLTVSGVVCLYLFVTFGFSVT